MSRERCRSLDRVQKRHQERSFFPRGVYIPERYPNRLGLSACSSTEPQHVPSLPNLSRRYYGGANGIECPPYDDNFVFLEDIEEPQFYDLPPDSSFDELRCILATPPRAAQPTAPTASEKLDELRREIAAHISPSQNMVQVDDVRKRVKAAVADKPKGPPLCPYKIPPLPEDPRAIPPPPKNPKDVVAIIRRAQAIARLKALEEKEAPAKQPKELIKKGVRGLRAPKTSARPVTTVPKPKPAASKLSRPTAKPLPATGKPTQTKPIKPIKKVPPQKPVVVSKKKSQLQKPQHPPDYVPDEWAAAILRTRKIAGLKTTNPKLLPKSAIPRAPSKAKPAPQGPPSEAKRMSPLRQASPPPQKLATFESIMERVSEIRERANIAQAMLDERNRELLAPRPQEESEELDEFEALEELYGADKADQCIPVELGATDLQRRISVLQQQLLQSPIPADLMEEELDEFEALEKEFGAAPSREVSAVELIAGDIHDRINVLKETLFQSPQRRQSPVFEVPSILRYGDILQDREAMAAAAAQISVMQRTSPPTTTAKTTPLRSRSPVMAQQFDDAILQNIEVPDFDIHDVPEFAFSAEALADAGFGTEDDFSIGEISMPDFDEEVSFDELALEDISSPELYDLSISDDNLALEPDFPLETSAEEEDHVVEIDLTEEVPEQPGVLSSLVNTFRNVFSASKSPVIHDLEGMEGLDSMLELDISLPNVFEITPPKPKTPTPRTEAAQKPVTPKGPIVIPPHPKDPKDYKAMIKRAQAIQKKMAESAVAEAVDAISKDKKGKKIVKSSIPKAAPPPKKKIAMLKKKKGEKPTKIYPPGEYSPSYAKAVARARSLAGLKNLSAALNPERAAKIAERKAAREAKLAAIEALPPIERMREKMRSMRREMGGLPRPSIEMIAALDAIRESLPKTETRPPKRKWRPAGRLRVDRRVKPRERLFWRDFGRILIPTKKTQKKKGWKELSVMSPILEEPDARADLMQFSPLKPHEGRLRLRHLQEEASRKAVEALRTAEEQADIDDIDVVQISPTRFSPVRLHSPTSPRTEETKLQKTIRTLGPHGRPETIWEEVTESSTIEEGEMQTVSRQVTAKTDEYGTVSYHIQEGQGVSGEEEAIFEDLAQEEPPDFLDTSDIPPPRDPSIPTPSEIINRIRLRVQEQLSRDVQQSPIFPPASPEMIDLPQDLTEEELFDVEIPEFERTPQRLSPQVESFSPYEKDQRMYAWGEHPVATPPPRVSTPRKPPSPPKPVKVKTPISKEKTPEGIICIPPHPKDPKDYRAMVKRAQAIEKLMKQREPETAVVQKPLPKSGRLPISRWVKPPQKDLKKPPRKRLVLKKRVPKISPKKIEQPAADSDEPTEPPPLPQKYIEAVARARLLRGLKNKTALLNPEVAAKIAARKAAKEAAQAAYDALPEIEQIKIRVEKLRKIPLKKRQIKPSADLIGTLAAIRERIQAESVIAQVPQAPMHVRSLDVRPPSAELSIDKSVDESLERFEALEAELQKAHELSRDKSLEDFEALEAELQQAHALPVDRSLEEFEALEAQAQQLYETQAPAIRLLPSSPEGAPFIAPSMRMLAQAGFFENLQLGESILETLTRPELAQVTQIQDVLPLTEQLGESILETLTRPELAQVTQIQDVLPLTEHDDPLLEFRVPVEDIVLDTSQLMPETPPINIQERFQRLKIAQEKSAISSAYAEQYVASPTTPTVAYSPIKLVSPSGVVCIAPGADERQSPSAQPEWIVNIDETPIRPVRQFRDLEDMPFDELEYEIEPPLDDISFEKPLSPPPRPSDIIRRIKSRLAALTQRSPVLSPAILSLPEELPDEDLFELTAPAFVQTPIKTPPKKMKSPRVSLPMAWGEVRPATPVTPVALVAPVARVQTPIKVPTPVVQEKIITPEGPIVIPPHPKDPKDYAAMVRRARAIYKLTKQKEAEEAARTPQPVKPQPKGRVPISRWQGPPPRAVKTKPRKKLVLKKRVKEPPKKEIVKEYEEEEEREYPSEPPPLPQDYRDAVAKARLLHGLKNRTAALNPKIAARIEAYNALPEIEKIKARMARLRKKPQRRRHIKPTVEQVAYLEALKQMAEYQTSPPRPVTEARVMSRPLSITPRDDSRQISAAESRALAELAEFEALEQLDDADASLAEFEALEAIEAPPMVEAAQPLTTLNISQLISDLRRQHLVTPPVDPRERYRQLLAQRKAPQTPIYSPVKTPEIQYTPIILTPSPSKVRPRQRTPTQIDLELMEELGDIQEPSFLDITPSTPLERPRPLDIIEKIRTQVRKSYRPEVPTGHLVELRTPPRMLPLPTDVDEEELLGMSSPRLERTLPHSPVRSPTRSPVRSPDISIPQLFQVTPPPPTPPLPPVSPLRHRVPSPEGPLVIPAHPKDPKDYKTMVRRARKIQQLIEQNEAEARAAKEAEEAALAAEAAKAKKTRVPISRWVAPPPRKPGKRKKLVMRKRGEVLPSKTPAKSEEIIEYPAEPPPLPEYFAKEVALARKLAGLKSRTAALNPRVAAREAAKAEAKRKAEESEAAGLAALTAPPPPPLKDYTEVLSRVKELKGKGVSVRGRPSLAAAAYLNALKGAIQVLQDQHAATESPKTRYQRILAERTIQAPTFEESQVATPVHEDVRYTPICFVSPRVGDAQIDLAESIEQREMEAAVFESLEDLEQLSELEQPSFLDVSQFQIPTDQYIPITPPQTPPPAPSAIIDRIRQQYQQEILAASPTISTPIAIQFPSELPEEELLELSAPSFVQTPVKAQTPIRSPDISIPLYFEETPIPVREKSPVPVLQRPVTPIVAAADEVLPGIFPGVKVKSTEPLVIPPHPKDPKDVAAMIRRAQIIQKILAKEAADKATTKKEAKSRVPLSRKIPGKGRKLVLKKKQSKSEATRPLRECPTEPPKLPAEYLAAVLKARKLAGLKPKGAVTQQPSTSAAAKVTKAAPSYAAIMEKVAALRAAKQKLKRAPTSRELTHRQHLINRMQRQQRKRQLMELERLRQQGLEPQPFKTPPPPQERFEAIKSRIAAQTPMSAVRPYSPVKTPEIVDLPQYQPLALPPTPPYQFLENVSIPDIADVSMPFEDLDNYTLEYEDADEDDLEFQLAEIANEAYQFGENVDMEPERAEGFFNIAERIQALQQQFLESSNREDENVLEAYNLAKRLEVLKNQLLYSPTQGESRAEGYVCVDMPPLDEDDEDLDRQDIYDELMDDFEAMERECL